MNLPLYATARAEPPTLETDGHRGLWFERFFNQFDERWRILEEQRDERTKKPLQGKAFWIQQVTKKDCGDPDQLERHAVSLYERATFLGGDIRGFETDWHFATGLGNPHPVENGFLWHPTLGVPYLPGAAVKGLVRAYMEQWDDSLDGEPRKQRLRTWFGTDDKSATPEQAGGLIFFDALPVGPVTLVQDVMTPHYDKWYEKGGEIEAKSERDLYSEENAKRIPADWHDPVPVPFLVVKSAKFVFAVAPRRREFQNEVKPALEALKDALEWLGAGAKTAVGYGRMQRKQSIEETVKGWADEKRQQQEAKRQEKEKQQRRAALSPLEQAIEEVVEQRQDKNLAPYLALIQAIDKNHWQGEDKRQVAAKIRDLMQQEKGQWKEKTTKDKPERDKEHQRTLKVKRWLEE